MHFFNSHMFKSRAGVNRSSSIQVCWKLKITFSLDAGPRTHKRVTHSNTLICKNKNHSAVCSRMKSFNSLRGQENWKTLQWLIHKNHYKSDLEIFCKTQIIIVLSHGGDHIHEEQWKNTVICHLWQLSEPQLLDKMWVTFWTIYKGFINCN